MNNVEIKVNIINQLKLFKMSTFKDLLCFLDEDIQNAQRAKAKNIKINYNDHKLTIENDGEILDDPQKLFSIAESGWDNTIVKNENPFGIGFFSNIVVSDYIEIYSGNKYIIFDVNNMINSGNTQLEVLENNEFVNGFKLVLNDIKKDIYDFEIEERLQLLANNIHELTIFFNNKHLKFLYFRCFCEYCFY